MSLFKSLFDLRRDYGKTAFNEDVAEESPFEQFGIWFEDAVKLDFLDVNAMIVSTASKYGIPSSRVVLLKSWNEIGFVFFTNYESRKGHDLAENPHASILFFWDKLERQIRIDGIIEKISEEESYNYFKTRPYESRLGAWASHQSEVLKSRFTLLREVTKLMTKYPVEVPLPPYWGGYRLIPNVFEFWQGRPSRLHDRIRYRKDQNNWIKDRLSP